MRVGNDEHSVSSVIYDQLEFIFSTFNHLYFNDELEMPLFELKQKTKTVSFNSDFVINKGVKYAHEIILPISILNDKIDEIAACILHNMIHYYGSIHELNISSNNETYHNKKFKKIAEEVGLLVEYDKIYGWQTFTNKDFSNKCKELGFKKTWRNYYSKYQNINNHSSTRKYTDISSGESVRATKEHILFCLDDHPEIADEIERKYNIQRMKCL